MYNHCALSTSQFNRTLYKRAASNIQVPGAGITMSGAQKHACYDELDANLLAAEPNLIKWRRQIHQNPELGYACCCSRCLVHWFSEDKLTRRPIDCCRWYSSQSR
jgi:hypothetical protein